MNVTLTLLLLLFVTVHAADGAPSPNALWHFGLMINCAQPGVNPLIYNNYGCWCGLGGQGSPLDPLDTCCRVHDKCYEASRKVPECSDLVELPYIIEYDFSCSNKQVTCSASNNRCQAAVCECDRVAAHCFARSTYNHQHKDVDPDVSCVKLDM